MNDMFESLPEDEITPKTRMTFSEWTAFAATSTEYRLMKRCTSALHSGDRLTDVNHFHIRTDSVDGRQPVCKSCTSIHNRFNALKNKQLKDLTADEIAMYLEYKKSKGGQ